MFRLARISPLRFFSSIQRLVVGCLLTLAVSPAGFAAPTPTAPSASSDPLAHEVHARLSRVPEIQFLREEADKLGIRAWLFGGTAASYAHYVRWDLMREGGDPRFQADRFDYDYTNIFRSTQDFDIVVDTVDGRPDPELVGKIATLQSRLAATFPHLQGNKTAWEVRSLRTNLDGKEAILDNPGFQDQHSDSHSTGLIEVTPPPPGENPIRDARNWNGKHPAFFEDVRNGALHYYYSDRHAQTQRFKDGLNPPIFSVIRYLTKVFQYELTPSRQDWTRIQKIIADFNPARDLTTDYAKHWIEKNGKKLLQHAVNLEYAVRTLDDLGLRDRLRALGNPGTQDSLAWWMSKEPLRSLALTPAPGQTARELGIDIVAHETNNMLAYESITRAHTGDPNVLISREGHTGEAAFHGDGFYTARGTSGARGTGLTIRFQVEPTAVLGRDFTIADDFVIFKNKNALKVVPESLSLDPVQYFSLLSKGAMARVDPSNRALLEKLKRKLKSNFYATIAKGTLSAEDISELNRIAENELKSRTLNSHFWQEWLSNPVSHLDPSWPARLTPTLSLYQRFDFVEQLLNGKSPNPKLVADLTLDPHSQRVWAKLLREPKHRESLKLLLRARRNTMFEMKREAEKELRIGRIIHAHWRVWLSTPLAQRDLSWPARIIEAPPHQWELAKPILEGVSPGNPKLASLLQEPKNDHALERLLSARRNSILALGKRKTNTLGENSKFWIEWASLPESVEHFHDIARMYETLPTDRISSLGNYFSNHEHWRKFWEGPEILKHPMGQVLALATRSPKRGVDDYDHWITALQDRLLSPSSAPEIMYQTFNKYLIEPRKRLFSDKEIGSNAEILERARNQLTMNAHRFPPEYFNDEAHRGMALVTLGDFFRRSSSPSPERIALAKALFIAAPQVTLDALLSEDASAFNPYQMIRSHDPDHKWFRLIFRQDPIRALKWLKQFQIERQGTHYSSSWIEQAESIILESDFSKLSSLLGKNPFVLVRSDMLTPLSPVTIRLLKTLPPTQEVRDAMTNLINNLPVFNSKMLATLFRHTLNRPEFLALPETGNWLKRIVDIQMVLSRESRDSLLLLTYFELTWKYGLFTAAHREAFEYFRSKMLSDIPREYDPLLASWAKRLEDSNFASCLASALSKGNR